VGFVVYEKHAALDLWSTTSSPRGICGLRRAVRGICGLHSTVRVESVVYKVAV